MTKPPSQYQSILQKELHRPEVKAAWEQHKRKLEVGRVKGFTYKELGYDKKRRWNDRKE